MSEYQLNPQEQQKLNNAIEEMVDSLIRTEAEKQFRKDVTDRIKEEIGLKPTELNALAGERFESKASEKMEKLESIIELNELLLNNCKKSTTSPVG